MVLERVRKRDGKLVPYNRAKIERVLRLAAESVEVVVDAPKLAEQVERKLFKAYAAESGARIPHVEDIQDLVEEVLMQAGLHRVARHFILYREQRAAERSAKSALIGKSVQTDLSLNALKLLRERYLLRDEQRGWFESPNEMFERVARAVAAAERKYSQDDAVERRWRARFKRVMRNLDFLPNSPCLMNAGTAYGQLSSSVAIPVRDDLGSIYRALSDAARMQQAGAGTGFNFSGLRRRGAPVKGIGGAASGPLTFLSLFNASAAVVKQAGRRQGGNIAILDVTHPDILDFVTAKAKQETLEHFNLSVLINDEFVHAVIADKEYSLREPSSGEAVGRINAKQVFDIIVASAWNYADPGILFKDAIARGNPLPDAGLCATSACAEFLLGEYEQGFLGSVNLANFVTDARELDERRLREVVAIAVRFLDDMIDVSTYPVKRAQTASWRRRKIGVGVMGLAHMLVQLGIPYGSEEGVRAASEAVRVIREAADDASEALAEERSPYPDWTRSTHSRKSRHFKGEERKFRNATRLAVSPTGSTSMIAETSSGIEPLFSVSYVKKVLGGEEFYYVDPYLKASLEDANIYSEEIVERIANFGLQAGDVPEEVKRIFVTTHDISPEWHVRMQAAIQEHVDNAVSKTVNLPRNATLLDVENIFLLAWKLGCKGCTVYRDGSRTGQVLTPTALLGRKHDAGARSVRDELKVLASNKSLSEFAR